MEEETHKSASGRTLQFPPVSTHTSAIAATTTAAAVYNTPLDPSTHDAIKPDSAIGLSVSTPDAASVAANVDNTHMQAYPNESTTTLQPSMIISSALVLLETSSETSRRMAPPSKETSTQSTMRATTQTDEILTEPTESTENPEEECAKDLSDYKFLTEMEEENTDRNNNNNNNNNNVIESANPVATQNERTSAESLRSVGSFVCRICHNSENPEKLVSPCLCKGSLSYVHIYCLEHWISTSRNTICELCRFQYNTEQTLRYTCFESLRLWYTRSISRRALQEDCQMFSLLTLVAFGIIGTLLVGIQYYFLQGHTWGLSRIWTKSWLIFFLLTTVLAIYVINIYMIVRSQLAPWYRWWQSARDIKLILEDRKPFHLRASQAAAATTNQQAVNNIPATTELDSNLQQVFEPNCTEPPPPPPPPEPHVPTPASAHIALNMADMYNYNDINDSKSMPLTTLAAAPI